ncbi:MAG: hypothetical protein EOP04_10905 [Proteobacteria bacterium]|nr:MAG: hypothetical protein EOP04_10905 [Pseudomonadota bacterium]
MNCMIQRILFGLSGIWLMLACSAGDCKAADLSPRRSVKQDTTEKTSMDRKEKKWVFLNASKNRNGITSKLAQITLKGLPYKSINLVDFHIDQVGQQSKTTNI